MRDTPVPMSNTVVKSHYAGSSWGLPPVRYGRCQAKRSDCEAAFIGSLAQLGEHLPYKQRVGGSNPSTPIRSRSVVVITSPCHGEDRGFKSRRGCQYLCGTTQYWGLVRALHQSHHLYPYVA